MADLCGPPFRVRLARRSSSGCCLVAGVLPRWAGGCARLQEPQSNELTYKEQRVVKRECLCCLYYSLICLLMGELAFSGWSSCRLVPTFTHSNKRHCYRERRAAKHASLINDAIAQLERRQHPVRTPSEPVSTTCVRNLTTTQLRLAATLQKSPVS